MVALDPLSGVMKDIGDRYHLGIKFAVEEINTAGGLLGRPIKMFLDDSQLKPDIAARKASRYITEEKVEFIMTGTGTHIGKAMGQVAEKEKVIMLNYGAAGDILTGKDFTPYHFRVALSTGQQSGALAAYFAGTPYRKYYILCQDYAFGHDVADAFKKAMNKFKPGWQLAGEDYHPLGAKDLGPYISKVIASGAEVLITGNWGADILVLLKQGAGLGLKAKIGNYFLSDPVALPAIGDAAIGHVTADSYLITIDNPDNKKFLQEWYTKHKGLDIGFWYPNLSMGRCYYAIQWLAEVIKKAGGTDADKIIKAWEGMSFNPPWGKVTMRACDHQMITPGVAAVCQSKSEFYAFPYFGKAIIIPEEEVTVPPAETGNPRCK